MKKAPILPSTTTLARVVDLLIEQKIKLDAWDRVLKETNPLVHELYLGMIEELQAQKAAEVKKVFPGNLIRELGES